MDLPAVDHLGYALNLIDATPFDINVVNNYVIRTRRLLSINFNNVHDVVIDGVTYSVPLDVTVVTDKQIVQGELVTFPNGREAESAFSGDPSYPLRYWAISGSTSAMHAARNFFRESQQYAFFSYMEGSYAAARRDLAKSLVEAPLLAGLDGIPIPFDSSNATTVEKYKIFFRDYGSHIINNVDYGARYPLQVWASNEDPEVNRMFDADVKAMFNGIPSRGEFDESVKSQAQYKKFSEYFQFLAVTSGGGDKSKLTNTDATYADYLEWIGTIERNRSDPLNFEVIEVWTLMKFANSLVLRSYADALYDAFMWFVRPDVYKTAVVLDIQSDWAQFNLLTPGAVIIPDPANPYPEDTVVSDTHVQWGKEHSHDYRRQTLRFFVINDGSPLDISTSHGSSAGPGGKGMVIASIEGNSYTNEVITDNILNTKWFYNVPVSSVPERPVAKAGKASKSFYAWSDVLEDYLSESEMSTKA